MKLVWKGKYTQEQQLRVGNLPERAVKFKEPGSPATLNLVASLFCIPVFIIIGIAILARQALYAQIISFNMFNSVGVLIAFFMLIPHEFLHAICFPKDAEVQIWYSPKNLMAFVFSTYPLSKRRFIFISLLPNIILGFLPLLVWVLLPTDMVRFPEGLFSFAAINLLFGIGDYLNVLNAAMQMPKNSVTQLYGFNSYWYFR